MSKPLIKICGIKSLEIALHCEEYGADFIGLNFSPQSKRCISLSNALHIKNELQRRDSKLKIVALFYQNSREDIQNVLENLKPDYIQYVERDTTVEKEFLESFQIPLIPQIQVKDFIQDKDLPKNEFVILDSYHKSQGGGTGQTFPWEYVKDVRRKFFLAGGLKSDNVKQAVELLQPFGLDVASGVEINGEKDRNLIRKFIQNARA